VGQPRSSQRYEPRVRDDEAKLVSRMLELVRRYPRYGYRRITAKLRQEGWPVDFLSAGQPPASLLPKRTSAASWATNIPGCLQQTSTDNNETTNLPKP